MSGRSGGGRVHVRTSSEALDPEALRRSVRTDADGAVLVFVGTMRDHNDGRPVSGLAYECYREMAEKELAAIAREARSRWKVGRVAVEHRVGELELGEAAVVVAVAAPHRGPCYEASRYVMESLKRRAPIWKRETYADGTEDWVSGARPEPGGAGAEPTADEDRQSRPTPATGTEAAS